MSPMIFGSSRSDCRRGMFVKLADTTERMRKMRKALCACLFGVAAMSGLAWADGKSDLDECERASNAGEYDMAIALCNLALRSGDLSDRDAAWAMISRARAYDAKGNHDRAIQDNTRAVELSPDLGLAYIQRGIAYTEKGDYDRAINDLDQAIKLMPDEALPYVGRGMAYREKANYDRAIQDFNKAAQVNPDSVSAYLGLGFTYYRKGDFDRAIENYDRAIALQPDEAGLYQHRGLAYLRERKYDRAIQDYDQAVSLKPDEAKSYLDRGWAYGKKDEYDRAIKDYTRALELKPCDFSTYVRRGQAYYAKGDNDQAIKDYDQAIELRPDLIVAHYWRGAALQAKGDGDSAAQGFRQATKFTPDYPAAWRYKGFSEFNLGLYAEAAASLSERVQRPEADLYDVLFLYLARQQVRPGGTDELSAQAKNFDLGKWPGPIVRYILGQLSRADALNAANDPDTKVAQGQQCEAEFYVGELALLAKHLDEAKQRFQHDLEICPKDFIELTGARVELTHL